MSESKVVTACQSSMVTVEAWKIPELHHNENFGAPGWAVTTLLTQARDTHGGYGALVGRWIVRERDTTTKILHASDFQRLYVTYTALNDGSVRALYCQASAEVSGKDYLTRMAAYLKHLGNLWEGPDGCSTYELEFLETYAAKLREFAHRSEAASKQKIMPFLYLPKPAA